MANRRTALLVMDAQTGIADTIGEPSVVARMATALDAARSHDVLPVLVKVAFRGGHPEVSSRNVMFAPMASAGRFVAGQSSVLDPAIEVQPGDVVVDKRRVSAFAGSDLELVLRSNDVAHLVLSGISTSGVVLSTVRAAADMDFELTVLADACADRDAEVHRVLVDKVFPRQATVMSVEDWVRSLTP